MGCTAGAKDIKKRERRLMTEREKKKRKEDKQRQQQRENEAAKARFVAAMAAPAADDAKQEDDIHYNEVAVNECRGTADLGNIAAEFDDDWDEEGPTESVMQAYLKAIMVRFQTEDSPDFRKEHPKGEQWLQEFLADHGFWIRKECAPLLCKKLGIHMSDPAYYRDVRMWFPDAEGGHGMCKPFCVTCKRQTYVRVHGYPTHHPGRRVATFDSHYYIMSRQYCCTECKKEHETRKERAKRDKQPFKKVQYTFMGHHNEVLKRLPDDLKYKFPAVLSHRAGLDKNLVRSLRPLMDLGLRPDGVSQWLLELHSLEYTESCISHEVRLEREQAFSPSLRKPMFSKFDNKMQYNGGVPSSCYLGDVHKTECERIQSGQDREVKKVSIADQFSIGSCHETSSVCPLTEHLTPNTSVPF